MCSEMIFHNYSNHVYLNHHYFTQWPSFGHSGHPLGTVYLSILKEIRIEFPQSQLECLSLNETPVSHTHPDPETKETSQKGGEVKRWQGTQDRAHHLEMVSSGCGKAVAPVNIQLWLPAQIKAVNIPTWVRGSSEGPIPTWGASDSWWLLREKEQLSAWCDLWYTAHAAVDNACICRQHWLNSAGYEGGGMKLAVEGRKEW